MSIPDQISPIGEDIHSMHLSLSASPSLSQTTSTPTPTSASAPQYPPRPEQTLASPLDATSHRIAPRVRLAENRPDSNRFDRLADLYSILVALEYVETLLLRDAISSREYSSSCSKLIFQYKVWMDSNASLITTIDDFVQEYSISCNVALIRLRSGLPATLAHGGSDIDMTQKSDTADLLNITELFITAMDALKLNMFAVDQLFPALKDILDGLSRLHSLPANHEVRDKIKHWVTTLNTMKASDELDEAQARQMSFDLEQAYASFKYFISQKNM